jgi:hypothetical protein
LNTQEAKAKTFDVFLCHNNEDEPTVREISQKLVKEGIKPWLDVKQIRPGTEWLPALRQQIESIKSAAVFVREGGLGPLAGPGDSGPFEPIRIWVFRSIYYNPEISYRRV